MCAFEWSGVPRVPASSRLARADKNGGVAKQEPDPEPRVHPDMPEDFPPRVMFDNVETTKANTEEILNLLRRDASERDDAAVAAN